MSENQFFRFFQPKNSWNFFYMRCCQLKIKVICVVDHKRESFKAVLKLGADDQPPGQNRKKILKRQSKNSQGLCHLCFHCFYRNV